MVGLVSRDQLGRADSGRDRKGADVIGDVAVARGHEVGQARARVFVLLLPQHEESGPFGVALVVVNDDVVAVRGGREEAVHAAGGQGAVGDDAIEHGPGVPVEFGCLAAVTGILEDGGDSGP